MNPLILALLGLLIVLVAAYFGREGGGFYGNLTPEGFSSSSDGNILTIRDGWMIYVYDSRKAYTRTNNWVARIIEENTRASDVSGVSLFKINSTSAIGLTYMDLNDARYEILRPIFPNSMGIYVKVPASSLLLNSYFGMDRVTNETDAKKIINALFVAKGDAEFAATLSEQLGLYVERRNDMATVDGLMESLYTNKARKAVTNVVTSENSYYK